MKKNEQQATRQKKKKAIVRRVAFIVALAVFLGSSGYLGYELVLVPYLNRQSLSRFQQLYTPSVPDKTPVASQEPGGEDEPKEPVVNEKFEPLLELNEDVIGWLTVPNTTLNYPVFFKPDGHDFYLKRDAEKKYNKLGSLYISDACSFLPSPSQVLVMYGHNMEDSDEMFGQLMKFKNADFLKQNPVFTFDSLYRDGKWKIIGICRASSDISHGDDFVYYNTQYATESAFGDFIKKMRIRSLYNIQDDVQYQDQLMVFSTCDYAFYGDRLIVVARKLREGETEEYVRACYQFEVNKAALYPNMYYSTYKKERPTEEQIEENYQAFYQKESTGEMAG